MVAMVLTLVACEKDDDSPFDDLRVATQSCTTKLVTDDFFGGFSAGTVANLSTSSITIGNQAYRLATKKDQNDGVYYAEVGVWYDGVRYSLELVDAYAGTDLFLVCADENPPVNPSKVNEFPQLTTAVNAKVNCRALVLETGLTTFGGQANAETLVMLTANTINIEGVYTYQVDAEAGMLTEIVFEGKIYRVPLQNAPTQQVRLTCARGIPSQMRELMAEIASTPQCSSIYLQTDVTTPDGVIPAFAPVKVSSQYLSLNRFQHYKVDTLNGTLVTINYNGKSFQVPFEVKLSNPIELGCEQSATLKLPVLNDRYELLLRSLGWNGNVLPAQKAWDLAPPCELEIVSEGRYSEVRFVVDIVRDSVSRYGIEISRSGITSTHWVTSSAQGQHHTLFYRGVAHSARFLPAIPYNGFSEVGCFR